MSGLTELIKLDTWNYHGIRGWGSIFESKLKVNGWFILIYNNLPGYFQGFCYFKAFFLLSEYQLIWCVLVNNQQSRTRGEVYYRGFDSFFNTSKWLSNVLVIIDLFTTFQDLVLDFKLCALYVQCIPLLVVLVAGFMEIMRHW